MTDREKIIDLVAEELESANKKYPLFSSPHEAFAVLREEVDELSDELRRIHGHMDFMWENVKADRDVETYRKRIYNAAISAAQESIQCAAMTMKIKQSNLYEE